MLSQGQGRIILCIKQRAFSKGAKPWTYALKYEFLFNAKIALKQHIKKAKSLQNSLKQDTQIISAQEELTKSAAVRLKNGVLSANDFLSEINELNALKLQHNYDEIEFLLEIVQIRQTLNDWAK